MNIDKDALTVSKLKQALKEIKEIVKYEDSKTEITARSINCDPYCGIAEIQLFTTINGIQFNIRKRLINKDGKNPKKETGIINDVNR